jgi:hypothetical protein
MEIRLNSNYIIKVLVFLFAVLFCANFVGILMKLFLINESSSNIIKRIITLFDFDSENNFPSLFSTALLFTSAILLLLISLKAKKDGKIYKTWLLLSVVFCFLSFDEILSFHEHLVAPTRNLLDTSGIFYFAWVIPYGFAVLIGLLLVHKILKELPKRTLSLFLWSLTLYLLGAIGIEMIGGLVAESRGMSNSMFYILYTIEESFEMIGIIIFIYGLLSFYNFKIIVNETLNESN